MVNHCEQKVNSFLWFQDLQLPPPYDVSTYFIMKMQQTPIGGGGLNSRSGCFNQRYSFVFESHTYAHSMQLWFFCFFLVSPKNSGGQGRSTGGVYNNPLDIFQTWVGQGLIRRSHRMSTWVDTSTHTTLEQSPVQVPVMSSTLIDVSDRTRTAISMLISC